MNKQTGSTLVVSLIFLTIITLVVVYSLEGSNLQSKMVANSLFTATIFQECRNEQEANVSFYNSNAGANRAILLNSIVTGTDIETSNTITEDSSRATDATLPKSDLSIQWRFLRVAPAFRGGYDIDNQAQNQANLFEHDCLATFRTSTNSQTLGAVVDGLQQAGNIN